jgi:hypothetical protein
MTKTDAGALIIRNLGVFEEASKLLSHEIERDIFAEIDRLVKDWASDHDWCGKFDWWKDQLSLAPREWVISEKDYEVQAHFEFWMRHSDDEGETDKSDYWYLTRLCGAGINDLGFKWYEIPAYLGTQGNRIRWKAFVRTRALPFEKLGFQFEEERGRFYMPVRLDQGRLAQAYEKGGIEDALTPVRDALDKLQRSVGAFTGLIKDARREFKKAIK